MAAGGGYVGGYASGVSTHSHPKVAAAFCSSLARSNLFQHTATRRWLPTPQTASYTLGTVSTHSHPKVAARNSLGIVTRTGVSTHSHPKVAACKPIASCKSFIVSTHSHPKVAAYFQGLPQDRLVCFNTQPPEGGCYSYKTGLYKLTEFQHTATRRWLLIF